jgi:hypothetical protein
MMKMPSKFILTLIGIPLVILLYFSTNIYGYFRFQHYCSSEGGLRVFEPLEKNVGWWAKDKYEAQVAALLSGVGFVRYTDQKDGNTYDLRYLGGNPTRDGSFERLPADESKTLFYKWESINEKIPNERYLMRYGAQILNIESNKILVYYYKFGYETLDPRHAFLSMPSEEYCFNEPSSREGKTDGFIVALNTAFKN